MMMLSSFATFRRGMFFLGVRDLRCRAARLARLCIVACGDVAPGRRGSVRAARRPWTEIGERWRRRRYCGGGRRLVGQSLLRCPRRTAKCEDKPRADQPNNSHEYPPRYAVK